MYLHMEEEEEEASSNPLAIPLACCIYIHLLYSCASLNESLLFLFRLAAAAASCCFRAHEGERILLSQTQTHAAVYTYVRMAEKGRQPIFPDDESFAMMYYVSEQYGRVKEKKEGKESTSVVLYCTYSTTMVFAINGLL